MSLSQNMNNKVIYSQAKSLFPQVNHKDAKLMLLSIKRHLYRASDRKKASYSLEAAVALPVFLGFAVCIIFFMRILMVEWTIDNAMTTAVDTIALCDDEPSLFAAETLFYEQLATDDVRLDAITGGVLGISLLESSVDKKNITLSAAYHVKPPIGMIFRRGILVHQKRSARIWNGYDPSEDSGDEVLVYVTPYGMAYHRSRTCPYINPSIVGVSKSSLVSRRNNGGHRYGRCPMCGKKAGSTVYITSWGECYHGDISCSGLKRTIDRMELSRARERYHPCKKCGGE